MQIVALDDCSELDDYDLEFRPITRGLEISAELKRRRNSTCLQFEIKVPRQYDIEFSSAGGGEVRVRDASRFVVARTGGGEIEIDIQAGAVTASTGAGDIDVAIEREADESDADVTLSTGYGDVELIVPKGFSMDLDLTIGYTRNSRRDYRIVSDVPFDEKRTSEWDYRHGDHGSAQKYIYGTGSIQGGRHRIEIRATNGDIRIRER